MAVPEIDVEQLEARQAEGALPVDVRQPDEYAEAPVPGAVLIPLDQLVDRLGEVPSDGAVYVICKSGGRSAAAVDFLLAEGRDAVNVVGGTQAWIASGRPVVTGDTAG